jgi:hypothetical protein
MTMYQLGYAYGVESLPCEHGADPTARLFCRGNGELHDGGPAQLNKKGRVTMTQLMEMSLADIAGALRSDMPVKVMFEHIEAGFTVKVLQIELNHVTIYGAEVFDNQKWEFRYWPETQNELQAARQGTELVYYLQDISNQVDINSSPQPKKRDDSDIPF